MRQALGPNGQFGSLDVLTSEELKQAMGHAIDPVMNYLRGEKLMRIPIVYGTATAGTFTLAAQAGQQQPGPESGYLWRIQKILVAAQGLFDGANYTLYSGSDTTQITPSRLMDAQVVTHAVTQPVPPAIVVGASPFTFVNVQPYTVLVTVTGGTVSSITVNGANTGATSGTFALLPDASMVVTYTVAPTMTEVNATANTPAQTGQNVNIAFRPGNKAEWLFPGEQIYAQIIGATVGNVYTLTGFVSQVPAEMVGKLVL